LKSVVDTKLKELDLVSFTNKKAGTLSGGNKRKLSVAIAMIGAPPVVFLDEPSTGMDPVARRFMWDVIAKIATSSKLCSIILTTHSMEECEALCSRIGIMVGGRLRCEGSIQHIKNRFGKGFAAEIKLDPPTAEYIERVAGTMKNLLGHTPDAPIDSITIKREMLPSIGTSLNAVERINEITPVGAGWTIHAAFERSFTPSPSAPPNSKEIPLLEFVSWWAIEDIAASCTNYITVVAFPEAEMNERQGSQLRFKIPPQKESLGKLFAKLEQAKKIVNIQSYSLGQTSLENIFNSFASQQEEERGVARGLK
jgi:energy-coupling factor transporter ATP-binding protein EcfA2